MSNLYAVIRPSSKYYALQNTEEPFPVTLGEPDFGGSVVKGGPGNAYQLDDVFLYTEERPKEVFLMPGQLATEGAVKSYNITAPRQDAVKRRPWRTVSINSTLDSKDQIKHKIEAFCDANDIEILDLTETVVGFDVGVKKIAHSAMLASEFRGRELG